MSRFAQYYAKYKHDAGCYDWKQRQQHLGALFDNNESIEFYMGEAEARKVYKHRVYHLGSAQGITVMRFANDIDIPVERDFKPALAVAMAIHENGTDSLDYFAMLQGWQMRL